MSSGPVSFSFSASIAGSTFQCRLDGPGSSIGSYQSCTSPASYNSLSPGSYTFYVRAIGAGGTDLTPASSAFTLQSSPPPAFPPATPTIVSPSNYSWVNTSTVTITGTATPGSTVEVFESERSLGTTTVNAAGSWSRQVVVGDGAQLFTATATSMGGTSAESPIRVVQVDTHAPAAPVITSPAEGASVPNQFTLSGTAEAGSTVELFENGQSRGTMAATGGQWSRDISGGAAGTRVYTVRATDMAGNVSATSAGRTVRVGA